MYNQFKAHVEPTKRTAAITGAASGAGLAMARRFSREGMTAGAAMSLPPPWRSWWPIPGFVLLSGRFPPTCLIRRQWRRWQTSFSEIRRGGGAVRQRRGWPDGDHQEGGCRRVGVGTGGQLVGGDQRNPFFHTPDAGGGWFWRRCGRTDSM